MKEVIPGITWLLGQGFDSNVYIIESNREALMIDSGAGKLINQQVHTISQSVELLQKVIEKKGITKFCLTHGHIDHIGGLLSLQLDDKWEISASVFEAEQLTSGNSSYLDPILNSICSPLVVTTLLSEGDIINVGKFSFEEPSDIVEEIVRLKAHIEEFALAMERDSAPGKRLNFLTQEMHREANTMGSKAATTEISHLSVSLREEIERIREQVQNIE